MDTVKPEEYWDIEGNLASAIVKGLKALGISATEMQAGDAKSGTRVEVVANIVGTKDRQDADENGNWVHTEYGMQVTLELFSPLENITEHRRIRGVLRGLLAREEPLWICRQLAHGMVGDFLPGDSQNAVQTGDTEFDEIVTATSFTCTYDTRGKPPAQPIEP